MYNTRKKATDGLTPQQRKCAEIEANNPMAGCKEIAEMTGQSIAAIWKYHCEDAYIDLVHKLTEKRFRRLEKEAVECLRVGMKRGNVKCATYILDYLGYKPTDNVNITSGDINIVIDDDNSETE